MVKIGARSWIRYLGSVIISILFTNCHSGGDSGNSIIIEPPLHIQLKLSSEPILKSDDTDPLHPWLIAVNDVVQFHAEDPRTGLRVDDKVKWEVTSGSTYGIIDANGRYTAPTAPTHLVVAASADNLSPQLRGGKDLKVIAAPSVIAFTANTTTSSEGQVVQITPIFSGGTGAIRTEEQLLSANVVSGIPMSVFPLVTTTYVLTITNLAGATAEQSLGVRIR
jgi:hypothetical protein